MADDKAISDDALATAFAGSEVFPMVQGGDNVNGNPSLMKDYITGSLGHPGYVSGSWYFGQQHPVFGTGAAQGANNIRLYPIFIGKAMTVTSLGARITTGAVSSNIALALYHNVNGRPGTLIDHTASIGSVSTGAVNAVLSGGSVVLPAGWYWIASCTDNAAVVCVGISSSANNPWGPEFIGSATQTDVNSTGSVVIGLSFAGTFGTWPDLTGQTFTNVTTTGQVWVVGLKAA